MRYLPQTSHSIHFKIKATVRSLLWPGFVGYHRANSAIFGYTYIGSGIKNSDLPFLL
jgi:radial spoke head protein 9